MQDDEFVCCTSVPYTGLSIDSACEGRLQWESKKVAPQNLDKSTKIASMCGYKLRTNWQNFTEIYLARVKI